MAHNKELNQAGRRAGMQPSTFPMRPLDVIGATVIATLVPAPTRIARCVNVLNREPQPPQWDPPGISWQRKKRSDHCQGCGFKHFLFSPLAGLQLDGWACVIGSSAGAVALGTKRLVYRPLQARNFTNRYQKLPYLKPEIHFPRLPSFWGPPASSFQVRLSLGIKLGHDLNHPLSQIRIYKKTLDIKIRASFRHLNSCKKNKQTIHIPNTSRYGISTCVYTLNHPNVGKWVIHSVSGYGILKNLVTQSILTPMQMQDPPNDTPEPFHNLKSLVITARSKKKQQQKNISQTKSLSLMVYKLILRVVYTMVSSICLGLFLRTLPGIPWVLGKPKSWRPPPYASRRPTRRCTCFCFAFVFRKKKAQQIGAMKKGALVT